MKTTNDKKGVGVMDKILVIIALATAVFISVMILIFIKCGSIPDTLCACYFGFIGGECGVMGWIKNVKERRKEREYELEDRAERKDEDERDTD